MNVSQRWRRGGESYRRRGEEFAHQTYGVELLPDDTTPKAFIVQHHYSGSYPAARCRVGLYRTTKSRVPELVGVAVFSVPARGCLKKRAGDASGVELGRFVLLDDVPFPGETWFLKRAFGVLESELPDLQAVVSFSDPLKRTTDAGNVVMPGHVGTIYQAFNGRFVGRTKVEHLWFDRHGRLVAPRGLAKLRSADHHRGQEAFYRRMLDAGADPRLIGENGRDYINRVLREGPFRRVRHPGNLAYVWAIGAGKKRTRKSFPDPMPFVKAVETT
jgi:hypothetical protein